MSTTRPTAPSGSDNDDDLVMVEDHQEQGSSHSVSTHLDVEQIEIHALKLSSSLRRLAQKQYRNDWGSVLLPRQLNTPQGASLQDDMFEHLSVQSAQAFLDWLSFDHSASQQLRVSCIEEAIEQLRQDDGVWRCVFDHPLYAQERQKSCKVLKDKIAENRERYKNGSARFGSHQMLDASLKVLKDKLSRGGYVDASLTSRELCSTMASVVKKVIVSANALLVALRHEPILLPLLAPSSNDLTSSHSNLAAAINEFSEEVKEHTHQLHTKKSVGPPR